MDFSAWFEAYLGGGWWAFDARHNQPRIGRILMATGRDAADVAITTSFGTSQLKKFFVITDEVADAVAPLPNTRAAGISVVQDGETGGCCLDSAQAQARLAK